MLNFEGLYDDRRSDYPPAEPPGHDPQAGPPKSDSNREDGEQGGEGKEIGEDI